MSDFGALQTAKPSLKAWYAKEIGSKTFFFFYIILSQYSIYLHLSE